MKKYIIALLTPNMDAIDNFAKDHSIPVDNKRKLLDDPRVREIYHEAVSEANSNLASYESIKKFFVLDQDFTVESGDLTPSLKVKRKVVDEKYKSIIQGLYGE